MFLFGGWDYETVLAMTDELVYGRRYGSFFDIINNLTVRELIEIFKVIQNKEHKKELESAVSQSNRNNKNIPTEEMSQELLNFLMDA